MTHDNDLNGHEVTVIEQFKALLRNRPDDVLMYCRIGGSIQPQDRALLAVALMAVLENTKQHSESMKLYVALQGFLNQTPLRNLLARVREAHIRDYRHTDGGSCPDPEHPDRRDPDCYLCGLASEIDRALEGIEGAIGELKLRIQNSELSVTSDE